MQKKYEDQVRLLIKCLPAIKKEECFAIKGGTAINLFYCDLPRLSVDIDLVYLPIEDRETTYKNVKSALDRIAQRLTTQGLTVKMTKANEAKLLCFDGIAEIKIEPNYTLRGYVFEPTIMEVCEKAQTLFGYAKANIISKPELWGGKICAALDRQHPRDLFDIHNLLDDGGITPEIKDGFISTLLGGNRPLHEMLAPNFQMNAKEFNDEFLGMTEVSFGFDDAKSAFATLVKEINNQLTPNDKQLLLDFVQLKADLSTSSIPHLDNLPGIKWKIKNLENLRDTNAEKFQEQYEKLKAIL